jgi:hypothetical protein
MQRAERRKAAAAAAAQAKALHDENVLKDNEQYIKAALRFAPGAESPANESLRDSDVREQTSEGKAQPGAAKSPSEAAPSRPKATNGTAGGPKVTKRKRSTDTPVWFKWTVGIFGLIGVIFAVLKAIGVL